MSRLVNDVTILMNELRKILNLKKKSSALPVHRAYQTVHMIY